MGILKPRGKGKILPYKFETTVLDSDGQRRTYIVHRSTALRDTVNNRRLAAKMEDEHRTAIATGRIHPKDDWPPAPTPEAVVDSFLSVAEQFLTSARLRIKPSSVVTYEVSLARLKTYPRLVNAPINAVTVGLVHGYADWQVANGKHSKVTVNVDLRTARAILNFAAQRAFILVAPRIKELNVGESGRHALSFEQERRYLIAARRDPRLYHMAILLLDTGLRPHREGFPLKWAQIRDGGLLVTSSKTASGGTESAPRFVPFTPRLAAILQMRRELTKGSPYVFPADSQSGHLETITKAHRLCCKRAGLRHFEVYVFRHTYASRLAESGLDRWHIKKAMGHSSAATSDRYIHPSEAHQIAGFEKFFQFLEAHILPENDTKTTH